MKPLSSEFAQLPGWIAGEAAAFAHRLVTAVENQLQERDAANQGLSEALARAQADLDATRAALKAERERAEAARADMARMTTEFENTLDDLRREQATVVGEQAIAYSSLPLDALLTMFNTLKRSTTLAEVLTNLVDGIAREFPRVALFDVRSHHLEGAHQVGFDFGRDICKVVIPLSVDSLLSRAVGSGRLETFFSALQGDPGGSVPFGGTPACAMAIPVVVQGSTIAVIYADDSDKPEFATVAPQMRAKFVELLQQHALLVLLRVEIDLKRVAELREFATLLVDEMEYAHVADAEAGHGALERQQGLTVSLDRSRRIFAQRAARESHGAAAVLEEHLKAVIKARSETVFGRDLAAVTGLANGTPRGSVLSMRR